MKTCKCCGRSSEWAALRLIGWTGWREGTEGETTEHRNCACGETLSELIPFAPELHGRRPEDIPFGMEAA